MFCFYSSKDININKLQYCQLMFSCENGLVFELGGEFSDYEVCLYKMNDQQFSSRFESLVTPTLEWIPIKI